MARNETTLIEDAVDAAIEAASDYVSSLPPGQKGWDRKEYAIADTAARKAIAIIMAAISPTAEV